MVWLDFIVAAVLGGIAAAIIVSVAARRRDVVWPGFWFYFTLMTLALWVVRLWVRPEVWTTYGWQLILLPVVGAIVVAALIAALLPRQPMTPQIRPEMDPGGFLSARDAVMTAEGGEVAPEIAMTTSGLLVWVVVIALAGAVIAGVVIALPNQ